MRKGVDVDVDGWRLQHCGHPTAVWPYFLSAPRGHVAEGLCIVSFNGLGFQTKAAALVVLRELVAGVASLTVDNCVGRTCCVLGRDAMGLHVPDDRRPLGARPELRDAE